MMRSADAGLDRANDGSMMEPRVRRIRRSIFRPRQQGQVAILFAMMLSALIGIVALSIDGGFVLAERRQAQSAADAGALAAAKSILDRQSTSAITAAGTSYGSRNADVPAGNVAVHHPPTSGEHAGDMNYVEVDIVKDVRKFFVGAVYGGPWQVSARAVAGIEPITDKAYALMALNPPGIYLNGSTGVYINGGSAISNDDISSSGGSNTFKAGGSIDAVGTIEGNPGWDASDGMNPGTSAVADPLAGTPAPPKGPSAPAFPDCSNTCTLEPGYYKNRGTLTIAGTATLQRGVYYFDGNTRLNLQNTASTIRGDGVLLYFTGNSSFTPGNGNIILKTPTTPLYPNAVNGLVLWIANCSTFDSAGNGLFDVEGVIYAPCSHVELHGTPQSVGIQVIVGDLVIKGTSDFTINYREYIKVQRPRVWLVE